MITFRAFLICKAFLICAILMIASESIVHALNAGQRQAVEQMLHSIEVLQEDPAGIDALSQWMDSQLESVEQEFKTLSQQIDHAKIRLQELEKIRDYLAQHPEQNTPAKKEKPAKTKQAITASSQDTLLSTQQIAFFEKKVRPLLVAKCLSCHSIDKNNVKGGLNLDNAAGWQIGGDSGPALIPSNIDDSLLIKVIRYDGNELQMPPQGKLKDEEIRIFEMWIEMGAPDPRDGKIIAKSEIDIEAGKKFWSFQPISKPKIPEVKNTEWAYTSVDHFIAEKLEQNNLTFSHDADKETLIRRAYFDLIGLPPTPKEIDAFLQDHSPDAFEKRIDRLLDYPRFGER